MTVNGLQSLVSDTYASVGDPCYFISEHQPQTLLFPVMQFSEQHKTHAHQNKKKQETFVSRTIRYANPKTVSTHSNSKEFNVKSTPGIARAMLRTFSCVLSVRTKCCK